MSIPAEILKVKPQNTRVKATSNPNEFNVIKRTCIYKNGKNVPKELGVIGKIINGIYYPLEKNNYDIDCKNYGQVAFANKCGYKIFEELMDVYKDDEVSKKIYIIALLRAINEDIKNDEIEVEYKTSFLSEIFPNVGLSKNVISNFLEKIGQSTTFIEEFMLRKIEACESHDIVVDGMLKSNNSETNIFSEFSRKGKIKGAKDFSLLYAYDLNLDEPIACSPYEGNMLDLTAFKDFITKYTIKNGFIIMDKGFNDEENIKIMKSKNIRYLIPLKQSSKIIKDFNLDKDFTDNFVFDNGDTIRCKLVKNNNRFYYAFKSTELKSIQEKAFTNNKIRKNIFNEKEYEKRESLFGLIVFESNKKINFKSIYKGYKKRWEIENLFRKYKNILDQSELNVHGNYRLFATEFINFLSSVILMKMNNFLSKIKLLDNYSYPLIMRYLSKCLKRRAVRKKEEWVDCITIKKINEIREKIGI